MGDRPWGPPPGLSFIKPRPPTPEEIAFREMYFERMLERAAKRELAVARKASDGSGTHARNLRQTRRRRLQCLDAVIDDILALQQKAAQLTAQGAGAWLWKADLVNASIKAQRYRPVLRRAEHAATEGCELSAAWLHRRAQDIARTIRSADQALHHDDSLTTPPV